MFVSRRRLEDVEGKLRAARKQRKKVEEEFVAARDELVAAQIKIAVLEERLDLLANYLPALEPPAETGRLHITEEQEDIEYALRHGQIDRGEYEELLKEAGLLSTEVEIDAYGVPQVI